MRLLIVPLSWCPAPELWLHHTDFRIHLLQAHHNALAHTDEFVMAVSCTKEHLSEAACQSSWGVERSPLDSFIIWIDSLLARVGSHLLPHPGHLPCLQSLFLQLCK